MSCFYMVLHYVLTFYTGWGWGYRQMCGADAHFSKRLSTNLQLVVIGGVKEYAAVCRTCYFLPEQVQTSTTKTTIKTVLHDQDPTSTAEPTIKTVLHEQIPFSTTETTIKTDLHERTPSSTTRATTDTQRTM